MNQLVCDTQFVARFNYTRKVSAREFAGYPSVIREPRRIVAKGSSAGAVRVTNGAAILAGCQSRYPLWASRRRVEAAGMSSTRAMAQRRTIRPTSHPFSGRQSHLVRFRALDRCESQFVLRSVLARCVFVPTSRDSPLSGPSRRVLSTTDVSVRSCHEVVPHRVEAAPASDGRVALNFVQACQGERVGRHANNIQEPHCRLDLRMAK